MCTCVHSPSARHRPLLTISSWPCLLFFKLSFNRKKWTLALLSFYLMKRGKRDKKKPEGKGNEKRLTKRYKDLVRNMNSSLWAYHSNGQNGIWTCIISYMPITHISVCPLTSCFYDNMSHRWPISSAVSGFAFDSFEADPTGRALLTLGAGRTRRTLRTWCSGKARSSWFTLKSAMYSRGGKKRYGG